MATKKQQNPNLPKSVADKIDAYKKANIMPDWEKRTVSKECRLLEKKLGITAIPPRQYIFLRKIAETMQVGGRMDLQRFAKDAGYSKTRAQNPTAMILKYIPDKLYSEIVGFSRKDVEYELTKLMRQDDDLAAKMRAIDLAAKITGMSSDESKVQVQVNTLGFTIAD